MMSYVKLTPGQKQPLRQIHGPYFTALQYMTCTLYPTGRLIYHRQSKLDRGLAIISPSFRKSSAITCAIGKKYVTKQSAIPNPSEAIDLSVMILNDE